MNGFLPIPSSPTAPRPSAPPWGDPRLMMALSSWRTSRVVLTMTTVVQLLPADPKRIAWGMATGVGALGDVFVSPTTRPDQDGFRIASATSDRWFDLFTFGALVNAAWNGYSSAGSTVTIYEVYRLN